MFHFMRIFSCHALFLFLCFNSVSAKIEGEEFFLKVPGLCKAIACMCTISCVTSLMTIAVMSINRYFYICHNDLYEKIFTKRNCIIICISLYSVGGFLVLLNTFGIGDHTFDPKSLECIWDRMATYYYTVAFSITLVWIPSLTIGLFYLRIFLFVRQHRRRIAAQTKQMRNQPSKSKNAAQLAKTLFVIYAVFVTCWAPYALLIVLDSENSFPHEVHVYVTMFAHLHPSINWFIYYMTNKHFTVAYKQLFRNVVSCGRAPNIAGEETIIETKRDVNTTVTSFEKSQKETAA